MVSDMSYFITLVITSLASQTVFKYVGEKIISEQKNDISEAQAHIEPPPLPHTGDFVNANLNFLPCLHWRASTNSRDCFEKEYLQLKCTNIRVG